MKAFSPSGILITGGNSLESDKEEDVLRKEFNLKVIDFAIKEKIPLLGVCYGMQIINHYFEGTLSRCSPDVHVNKKHKINFHEESLDQFSSVPIP